MKLNRGAVAVLGIFTLAPYVWFGLAIGYFLPRLTSMGQPDGISSEVYFTLFDRVWLTSIGVMITLVALVVVYLIHLHHSDLVPKEKRGPWTWMLLLFGFFLMPVYWYRYMWKASAYDAA
jgi:hypothetical protein